MAFRIITIALFAVSAVALCGAALAGDIYVDAAATGAGDGSSWPDAFTTIQAAIDAALPGDVVHVKPGIYAERIDFAGKPITVTSIDPLDPAVVASTVIDAQLGGSVVTFNSQETSSSVLIGFTLRNGTGTLIGGLRYGGGIFCGAGCSPTIRHNRIVDCAADVGGGIYAKGNTAPAITAGPAAAYPYVGKGQQVTLSVTATDPDNDTLNYTWTPLDGGSIIGSGATVNYSASTGGLRHIRVTVSDGRGGTAQAECEVTVIAINITTPLPQLAVGQTAAVMASVDPEIPDAQQYPVTITWSLVQGPAAGAFDPAVNGTPTATTINFTPTASGPGTIQVQYQVGTAVATSTAAILLNPIVDSITPNYGVLGTTVQPVIVGKNLARVNGIALSPAAGVTGSIRAGKTEDMLPVEFVISSAAAPGNRTILLNVPEGQVNTGVNFELRTPPAITADPTSLNLLTGGTGNITFSIPDAAPAGGTQLTLSSSAPVVATVPATAVIPEGLNSVQVTVSAVAYGQTTITANATGYYRAQVPVTVINPPLITFAPSPLNVAKGLVEKCTVSVSNPAPAGGLTINLSGGEGLVNCPATVVIAESKLSAQFGVGGVEQGSGAITASAAGYPDANLPVNVGPGQLNLFPSYLPIAAGMASTLQLSIPNDAPAGGLAVNVVSSNPSVATVPASVTIPEGQKSTAVPVTGVTAGQVTVTASAPGFADATAIVNVLPTFNISFLPGTLQMPPGVTKTTEVVISSAAPAGGLTITLANPSPDKVTVPDTVFIPEGAFAKTINVTGLDPSGGPVTITASCPGLTNGTLQVTVQPLLPLYMRADVKVGAGTYTTGSVGLTSGTAPAGGYTVALSSDDPSIVTVPALVTIPEGSSWTSFNITGVNPGSTTIRLTLTGFSDADTCNCVTPYFEWNNVPGSLMVGQTQSVRIYSKVPGGTYGYGNTVYNDTFQNVSQAVVASTVSSDPAVASVPATLTIPAGRNYSDYYTLTAVGPGTAKLTASAPGYTPSDSGTITVTPISIYFRADVTVGDGCRTTGTVGLTSGSAPAGGVTVSLSSDDPSIASVPAQVTIPEGSSWQSFTILGQSPGSTTIHVTAPGGYTEGDTCTVVTPTFTWNNVPASLQLGQTQSVRVYTYVPGGTYAYGNSIYNDTTQYVDQTLTIDVASSAPAVVSVPATMSIAAGRYYADYITITAVGAGTAHLTASAAEWTSKDSSDITVIGVTPYFRADVTVGDGCRTTGSVGLPSGSAPTGGYTFYLESLDPSIATVPAQVTIPAGSSWQSFTIVGVSPGTTKIRLTEPPEYGTFAEEDTVTVVTPTFTWYNVPASLQLGQTQSVRVHTYVPGGTYAYGNSMYTDTTQNVDQALTIDVVSSDPAVISAPSTMSMPAGRYYADNITITAAGAGTARLTASATDWTSKDSSTITVTGVTPYFRADVKVGQGCYTTGTVGLSSGTAPTGGYTFNLSSDDPSIASVPATVTIPAGSSWTSFQIAGNNVGSTTIRITAPGGYTEGDTCNVVTPTFEWSSVSSQLSIGGVDSVRVHSRVPGGTYGYGNSVYGDEYQNRSATLTVNMTSANSGVIQVPATTTIPAGRYYSDYFNMSAVGAGSSTLTASATGYTDGVSGLVTVVGPWMRADLTVGAGCRTTGYVGITGGVAPTGGYTVNLTVDDPSVVGVPATVTIPAGNSQTSFYIQGLTVGSTYTQMSVSGFIDRDQTTVVKPTFEWESVASSINVGANDSVYVQTYVPGGTYASGNGVYSRTYQEVPSALTVTISSENPSVLTAPATVTIAAGNYWTGYFNMTGVAVGTSTLTASAVGWDPKQTATITVTNPSGQAVPGALWMMAAKSGGPPIAMLPAMAIVGANGTLGDNSPAVQGWNSGPAIEYNVISGNTATIGGGLAVYNATVTVLGNIFAANTATTGAGGGAIYLDGSLANATVKSNTIVANVADSGIGGGIFRAAGTASITNCILWANGDDLFGCSATYSDVTDLISDPGTGNISVDPAFVQTNDSAAAGYYRLSPGSQCVNAGNPAYVLSPGETDIDGQTRIASNRVDIGADEVPDMNPPETNISGGPAQGSTACSVPVNFSWWGTDDTPGGITYSYQIDGGEWSAWASGTSVSYPALADGPHTFQVKAKDSSGNVDATPAKRDFQLDTAAPAISQIAPNAGRTSAIVAWTTNEPATSQVLYGLTDALGQATYVRSVMETAHSLTVTGLAPSTTYHYRVKSRDNCGHESTSDDMTFTTAADDTTPETRITSGPSEGSTVCSVPVIFAYTGSDDSTPTPSLTYSYRVDGGPWSAFDAATSASIGGLAAGDHTFEVKARDTSANEDATPAARRFTVKLDPPVISDVNSSVGQMQCTITWTTDQPATSQVEYGETTAYGMTSPVYSSMVTSHSVTLSGLSPSTTYHYVVHSRDSCDRDGVSTDQTFTTPADTGAPETYFTSGPADGGRVCSTSAQFCWSGTDTVTPTAQLVYAYKLDNGGWSTPSSETCRTFSSLAEGGHVLYVRAQDTSGNADATPAQRSFTVDLSTGVISNINSAAGSTEATVVWNTSKPMDSAVEYGTTTSYGSTTNLNASLVTDHTVVVSGLAPDTTYHYRVKSKDGCGRAAPDAPDKTFRTAPDSNAPQTSITSGPPDNGKACATTVDLCWTGSDNATPADQLVFSYKMDSDAWTQYASDTCHQFTGLAEGLHTFMVKAKDTAGNEDASPAVKYFYVDLTPPTIADGSIASYPKQSTCIINWRTSEPATAHVEYGTTAAYGKLSAIDSNMLSTHKVTLSGLTPATTYHYRVRSSDGCQEVVSDDQTFTTAAIQPPNLKPTQLTVPISTSAHATVKISWVIQSMGPGDAEGSWTDRLFFSADETIDQADILLWEGAGSSPMPVPYTYSKQVEVQMPMKPIGLYYIIIKTDAGETLAETIETDNVFAQPVTFTADKPMIAAPENINVRLDPQVAAYGQFDLSNIGNAAFTGVTATVTGAPASITLTTSNVAPQMDPLTNRRISYQVTASDESVLSCSPTVTFTCNEGASATVVFNLTVTPRQPKLVANPGYLSGPMVRGQQTFYECDITNQGGVPASDLRVLLPTSNWISLVTPADLGTINPGETKKVGLSLMPAADMALGDYTSNFVVVGANANLPVSFRFTCISTQTGSIKVIAEDEFTTFAEDHPYVSGATVTLKDYTTGEIKYQGTTNDAGIWLKEDVTEANYQLEVAAPKHGTYRSPVKIVAGQLKEVHAFMPRQLVTYTWTVEPIQIEDKYRVVLEATFETHVPAPVVTIEPRTQVVPVVEGQTATQYITITNHGLIAAHEVQVNINDTDAWYVTPAVRMIGELPPMTSVVVPIYVRAKADGPITDIPQVATSTVAAEAAAVRAAMRIQSESATPNDGGGGGSSGGQPSLCDVLNGKVVHVVYCSGGQWQTADFSMSPIILLLNVIDALGCVGGNIQSCISLACGLAQVDPCICALIDPLSAGGAYNIAQCLACHGLPGGGGSSGPGGGGGWGPGSGGGWIGPGGISGPTEVEEQVPCDPATRPQTISGLASAPGSNVLITSPPDIAKYGGKLVRYRVNVLP